MGLGTIGGSLALALMRAGWTVRGDAINARDRVAAYRRGIHIAPGAGKARIENLVKGVEAVIICVPPGELARVAADIASVVPKSIPIFHTCSLQSAKPLGLSPALAARLTATHPLAGSAGHGFIAAREDLFMNCLVSVAVPATLAARRAAIALWKAVGAREITSCPADEHDARMRWVSHLPQLAATALAAALADAGVPSSALGPGGRDTTRLATSPWRLWHALLAMSPSASAYPIRLLEAELEAMRRALEAGDLDRLGATWRRASSWRAGELAGANVELGPVKEIRGSRKASKAKKKGSARKAKPSKAASKAKTKSRAKAKPRTKTAKRPAGSKAAARRRR
jgi:prephenate dehydrogenase